jgi:heptaprenyl diphosphate synthase
MILLKKFTKLSTVGVSIAGAVMHNVGQIIVAIIVLENGLIIYYLPYLIISGVVTGILIGILGAILYKKIKILQTNVHM